MDPVAPMGNRFRPVGRISISRALIENAAKPREKQQTFTALALDLGVTFDSVNQVASRLRSKGKLAPSERQGLSVKKGWYYMGATPPAAPPEGASGPAPPASPPPPGLEESLRKASNGDFSAINVLNSDERRRGLSYLAQTAPPAVQVQAHKALEDMECAQGSVVGPPPPQSDEELVDRIAVILDGAGAEMAFAAMKKAFPKVAK